MKIDYELVEKIGVKYFIDIDSDEFIPVKFENGKIYIFQKGGFVLTSWNDSDMDVVKPIPPKPPVRVEYEQVDSVKPGDRLFWLDDGQYNPCLVIGWHPEQPVIAIEHDESIGCVMMSSLYRRIEKTVDWQDEVIDYIFGKYQPVSNEELSDELLGAIKGGLDFDCLTKDEFLEMCRVALRANGEL